MQWTSKVMHKKIRLQTRKILLLSWSLIATMVLRTRMVMNMQQPNQKMT